MPEILQKGFSTSKGSGIETYGNLTFWNKSREC